MIPLTISHYTLTNALGRGKHASLEALSAGRSGLRPCDLDDVDIPTWIGRVPDLEEMPLDQGFSEYDCRNNRLAQLGLLQDDFLHGIKEAVARYGADRIGVFLGTSTSVLQPQKPPIENGRMIAYPLITDQKAPIT
jgi:3-oxoacyl-[acyl-carrier-protein] synthase-1